MSSVITLECRKICMMRCILALALIELMQFLYLIVFLLLVNFHIFHMLDWISEGCSMMFSWYTWLSMMPLLAAIFIYCILLGRSLLSVKKYYPSRFKWLVDTFVKKLCFLLLHVLVGLLTAWLYTSFLHIDYRHFIIECYGTRCVNPRFTFLLFVGMAASSYHFIKKYLRQEPELELPFIQQMKLVEIRSLVYTTLYKSLLRSCLPTLGFGVLYWLLGAPFNQRCAYIFDVKEDKSLESLFAIVADLRLLFYTWLLCCQILGNMVLMQRVFTIFLARDMQFTIEQNPMLAQANSEITIVQALAMDCMPLIQNLAALKFYNISVANSIEQRQDIYALSRPGGHPHNWNQLSQQCLSMIDAFTDELATSVQKISTIKSTPLFTTVKPTSATEAAEKMLLRQYNADCGIRQLVQKQTMQAQHPLNNCVRAATNQSPTACQVINQQFDQVALYIERTLRTAFYSMPGLFYMFGEVEGAKTAFLLSNSQLIIWLAQGLAGICAASVVEDRYGAVQETLPQILRTLLRLKLELDKLNNVNFNGKKLDRNLVALKLAVKRSLYRMCSVFGEYLPDLIDEPVELCQLQSFVSNQSMRIIGTGNRS